MPVPSVASTDRRSIFVLTETSLPRLLWSVLCGRTVFLADVLPGIRPLRGPLTRLADWLIASGRLKTTQAIDPDLPWLEGSPGRGHYNDIHHRAEPRLHEAFALRPEDGLPMDYAIAIRKAASDTVGAFARVTLLAEWLEANRPRESWTLHGAPGFLAWLEQACRGTPAGYDRKPAAEPVRLLNGVNALMAGAAAAVWLMIRWRPVGRPPPETLWLLADRVDPLDIEVYREVVAGDRPFAILERSPAMRRRSVAGLDGYRRLVREDARLPLSLVLRLMGRALGELAVLWRHRAAHPPALFGAWCMLIAKRAMFDAFFHSFRPRYFWARDDYSLDHVIRALPLRAAGATAIGVCHGIPINTYVHMWREIDFDIYYLFGLHLYDRYYRQSWPAHMRVKAVGTYKMPAAHRRRLAAGIPSRPRDIAFFATASPRLAEFLRSMRDVALHFPDRRIYIKMKPGRNEQDRAALIGFTGSIPTNMIVTEDNSYDLMFDSITYAITSGSTVTVEALCYRLVSFVFEEPQFAYPYYADFPPLMVRDGQHLIDRIEAIEGGRERYDAEAFRPLIAYDADFIAILRGDLGLVPPA